MDLHTTYMGLTLRTPLVVSSSPITVSEEKIQQAVEAGAGAVILPTFFEEQVTKCGVDHPYFPDAEDYPLSPDSYFELLTNAADRRDVPIFTSLNCETEQGWETYAKKMQEAGAAGIELNIHHIASDKSTSGQDIEKQHLRILETVKRSVTIPVAVKLTPFYSSFTHMARKFDEAGADALVLFNRIYQPDFNIIAMELEPKLNLSAPSEMRLPLRWIAILKHRVDAALGAATGVQSGVEIIKYLLAGADAVMIASVLIQYGPAYIKTLLKDVEHWMESNEYKSIEEFRGIMSQHENENSSEFERALYIKMLTKYRHSNL